MRDSVLRQRLNNHRPFTLRAWSMELGSRRWTTHSMQRTAGQAKVLPWVTCKLAKEQIVPVHTRRGLGGRKEGDMGIAKGIAQRPHALFTCARGHLTWRQGRGACVRMALSPVPLHMLLA